MEQEKEKILFFLEGMYYAGKLPSKAEIHSTSRYLCNKIYLPGRDIEKLVAECVNIIHQKCENKEKDEIILKEVRSKYYHLTSQEKHSVP